MLRNRLSRAEILPDESAADAHGLARALIAAGGTPGPQGLPNQAPTVTIGLEGVALSFETRVNSYTANDQQFSAITALPGGDFVVVWSSNGQDGSGYGISSQRYNANGVAVGGEAGLNSTTAEDQIFPAITSLANGGYVVVWQSDLQDGSGTGVYAIRVNANGSYAGVTTRVNTTTANDQARPAITGLPGGGFVVVWQSQNQDGSGNGIYAQRYDASGVPLGGETRVNTFTTGAQEEPVIASLAGGGYVVAWESFGQDGSSDGVYAQRYDANGLPQGGETRVNTYTTDNQYYHTIEGLAGGGYVVAWTSSGQDGDSFGVYAQRYDANGVPQGAETRINTFTAGDQSVPAVTALLDGGYVIAWHSAGQDGSNYGIYAQRFDANGVPEGPETRVNTVTANAQRFPAATTLTSGDYVVVWQSDGQDGSGEGVYAQRFSGGELIATEQTLFDLKGRIDVADADAGVGTITVTLAVAQGIITVTAGTTGAAVSGSGTATVTINGTLAQIQGLLQSSFSGTVSFTPNIDNPPATIPLTVTVNDNGSTGDGGPRSATATTEIDIIPVNDAPMSFIANRNIVLGNNYTFMTGDFLFSDPEGHGLLSVTISTLPNQGAILLNGAPIVAGSVIAASAIAAGALTYAPDPGETGLPYTSFSWQARDNGGTANGGQDIDLTPAFIYFNVSANPVYLYGFDTLDGTYPTIQAALDAAAGFQYIVVAAGTYSGAVTFDVAGLIVTFDPGAVQNMTWSPVGNIAIEINAGDGNDTITTGGGADIIRGGGGNDTLNGKGGDDSMRGGLSNDIYIVDAQGDVIVELAGQGDDTIGASASYILAAGVSIEAISTTSQSGTSAITLWGNEVAQSIFGNEGNNQLLGLGGNDQLTGYGGNDVLVGGAGIDYLRGGLGNDVYGIGEGDIILEVAGEGDDSLAADIGSYFLNDGASIETLSTANQAGTFAQNLTGNNFAQSIAGSEGANVLNGNLGIDLLRGYGGADIFFFDTAAGLSNHDVIADMQVGVDKIALQNAVFTGLTEGNLGANAFRVGTAAQDADDRIIWNAATNQLFYDADGNGAGAAVLFAIVNGSPGLQATDFMIV